MRSGRLKTVGAKDRWGFPTFAGISHQKLVLGTSSQNVLTSPAPEARQNRLLEPRPYSASLCYLGGNSRLKMRVRTEGPYYY